LQYIYIRLIVVSNTVQTDIYIRLIVVSNTVQTDIIYIRLIVVSNTVQTVIYRVCSRETRLSRIGVCKVVARDREQYSE
jgi:hypothetical protein